MMQTLLLVVVVVVQVVALLVREAFVREAHRS